MAPIDFLSSNVLYNNLNGVGPTTTDPTQILVSNVGSTTPTSGATMGMRIVSDSVYQAHKPNRNGPNAKGFFVLNIRGEVDTILNFTFVDDNSQDPVTVPNFVISIYHLTFEKCQHFFNLLKVSFQLTVDKFETLYG